MQFKLMFTQKANDFYMVVYCVSETSLFKSVLFKLLQPGLQKNIPEDKVEWCW